MTTMFCHIFAPESGHPASKDNFVENKKCKVLFLSHTCKLNRQKQRDVVSRSAADIYPSNKYDFFPACLFLTNHETLYNLNTVLSFHPPFGPITLFAIIGL